MIDLLARFARVCWHPFTTTCGHVETCTWCGAWRSLFSRTVPGQGYSGPPTAWRRD